jgi:hypothetical protein
MPNYKEEKLRYRYVILKWYFLTKFLQFSKKETGSSNKYGDQKNYNKGSSDQR